MLMLKHQHGIYGYKIFWIFTMSTLTGADQNAGAFLFRVQGSGGAPKFESRDEGLGIRNLNDL